jgi:hypothetical protein
MGLPASAHRRDLLFAGDTVRRVFDHVNVEVVCHDR